MKAKSAAATTQDNEVEGFLDTKASYNVATEVPQVQQQDWAKAKVHKQDVHQRIVKPETYQSQDGYLSR